MKKQMKVTGTTFSLLGFDELDNKFTISTICGNLVIIPKVLPYQFLRFSFNGIIDSTTATGAVNYIKELYGINDEDLHWILWKIQLPTIFYVPRKLLQLFKIE